MSYSVRNTIILLTALVLLAGSGWGYIHFKMNPRIDTLQTSLEAKKKELASMQSAVQGFEKLHTTLNSGKARLRQYPKALFPSDDHSVIYGFLNRANQGRAFIRTNIVSRSTNTFDTYGVLTTEYEGSGRFSNLYRFITAVEFSRPINKITSLDLVASDDIEHLGEVSINMRLESYFSLDSTQSTDHSVLQISANKVNLRQLPTIQSDVIRQLRQGDTVRVVTENASWVKVHSRQRTGWISRLFLRPVEFSTLLMVRQPGLPVNSRLFYPLIHGIPPNTDELIDVEKSRLIGITNDKIFLMDQSGKLQELTVGDRVYLGSLSAIDQENESVTFLLNKGGIIDKYQMHIQQPSENQ